ncbi:MAG: pseudouridine-5'-phosphate glycosidase, partial [Planctomycetota bacterium]
TILAFRAAAPAPILVFATGGIGGVHRGFAALPDISADLMAIRDGGTMFVTAGAKSILDLPATLELLDTLGVPTVGLGTGHFPLFLSPGTAALPTSARTADAASAATIFAAHQRFYPSRGMLLCVPPPASDALPSETMEAAVAEGLRECERGGIHGPEVTPVLLSAVARATGGASLRANIAVLVHNAQIGARVVVALAARGASQPLKR